MRRAFALILAALFICVVFAGCGDDDKKSRDKDFDEQTKDYEGMIVTEVKMDYTVELADEFAESAEPDFEKDIVKYAFEEDKYDEFLVELHDIVKEELREKIESKIQYTHVNLNTPEVIIGLTEESYYGYSEDELEQEAEEIGKVAVKYQLNTENPVLSVEISYRDAENGDEFSFFTYTYDYE